MFRETLSFIGITGFMAGTLIYMVASVAIDKQNNERITKLEDEVAKLRKGV